MCNHQHYLSPTEAKTIVEDQQQQSPKKDDDRRSFSWWETLLCYSLLGFLHEVAHAFAAWYLFGSAIFLPPAEDSSYYSNVILWLLRALLGRQFHLPAGDLLWSSSNHEDEDSTLHVDAKIFIIRHTGWLFSLIFAIGLHYLCWAESKAAATKGRKEQHQQEGMLVWTAYIVALEAVVTDLFQFTPVIGTTSSATTTISFFCGNFGAILLNAAWAKDNYDAALTMLQQMTRITMIRGAQSGGLVTFVQNHDKAIRNRVVNRKRTDLSDKLFQQVRRSMKNSSSSRGAKMFVGHTRFATTSIADFDGTHPHQFSPRRNRNIYDMQTGNCAVRGVENFITHNGT